MRSILPASLRGLTALSICLSLSGLTAKAQTFTNGSFDNIDAACASDVVTRPNPFADGCVPGWNSSHGTPDINGTSSDYYAFMYGAFYESQRGQEGSEGIFTSFAFQSGQQYTFTFWARNVGNQSGSPTLVINVANGLQEGGYQGVNPQSVPTTGVTRQEVGRRTVTGTWAQYSLTFTPTTSATQFWLFTAANITVGSNNSTPHQIEVNGLTFPTACNTGDIAYQNTSSLPALTKTQGRISAGSTIISTQPQGPVTVTNGQDAAFRSLGTIALTNDFGVEFGSTFSAVVVPCGRFNSREEATASSNSESVEASIPPQTACGCLGAAAPSAQKTTAENLASRPVSAAKREGVSADVQEQIAELQIYPRPAHDQLVVNIPAAMDLSATGVILANAAKISSEQTGVIYNSLGREVQRVTLQTGANVVPVRSLLPGIYYLHTKWNGEIIKTRFSIAH